MDYAWPRLGIKEATYFEKKGNTIYAPVHRSFALDFQEEKKRIKLLI